MPSTPQPRTVVSTSSPESGRYVPVAAAEFTAEGTANILVNKYIPPRGYLRTILSDNGLQFRSKLSQAVYQLLREVFGGGLSCHSAFFVSPLRHTGGTRQVFDGWFALLWCLRFLQLLLFAFFLAS